MRDYKGYSDKEISDAIDHWVVGRFAERNRIILKLRLVHGYSYDHIADWLKQNDDIRDEYKIEPKQISRVIGEWEMIIFSHI